jgi:glycosyltransferase involved in cell wall biosynthesis
VRLGIVSDAYHYLDDEGRLCTLTLLARQFEQWAALFDEIIVCAPMLAGPPPATHSPYRLSNIRLLAVPVAGGNTTRAKLDLVAKLPGWGLALSQLIADVDAVHIRCPNNISILGLMALARSDRLRQALYTGQWSGYAGEPPTYRLQRYVLKRMFRGPVAVYGEWHDQPAHIVPSFSPSYSLTDWQAEAEDVTRRLEQIRARSRAVPPFQLLSVGNLSRNKNQQLVIRAVGALREMGVDVELHLLGDGEERDRLAQLAASLGIAGQVKLHGAVAHDRVREFYRTADFVVQAPIAEGYGKVPIEAFFHGAVPILTDVNLSAQLVGGSLRGRTFRQGNYEQLARIIIELAARPDQIAAMVEAGRAYAATLTLEMWRGHLRSMLEQHWQVRLQPRTALQG